MARIHELLRQHGASAAVAESLTGGLVCELLTGAPGASGTFRGGVIAYALEVKASVLGVSGALLEARGAVDPDVAAAMAAGVRDLLGASYGLGLTGVAGPGPQEGKPAGTVHIALATSAGEHTHASPRFAGDRACVRERAARCALDLLRRHLLGHIASTGWEH